MRIGNRFVTMFVFCLAGLGFLFAQQGTAQSVRGADDAQAAVVHLSHFTDDLHRAFMALKVANMMQEGGVQTTVFLDIEGARIGDARQSLKVRWGASETTLEVLFEKFTAAGGKVAVCPHLSLIHI